MSLALARKYRPKKFSEVAVQSHVSSTLRGAIARDRVAHGYLLCGPRGTGKTTLARVLAMALNCERRHEARDPSEISEPCGECISCRRIWSGSTSLDVVEIDAASNRGVDDARELRERAMYAPSSESSYKVYIVDEAHMLTRDAWNALLKILEEPPPRVVFVFATTEPQKIAQAAAPVLSRVQRFDLKRIGAADIRERLSRVLNEEHVVAEPEALAAIARAADGSMRDALSLTDQVLSMSEGHITAECVREALGLVPEDELIAMLDLVAEHRAAEVFPAVARLAEGGVDFGGLLSGLADMLRALLAIAVGGAPPDVSESAREALETRRQCFSAADLLRMLQAIGELEPRFRRSGQQQLLVETLLVRFALLDRSVELEDVLRSLGTGAADRGGGGALPRAGARESRDPSAPASRSEARPDLQPGSRQTARATAAEVPGAGVSPRAIPHASSRPGASAASNTAPAIAADPLGRSTAPAETLELNKIVGRWDDVVERVRAAGKPMLASALEHASLAAVTAAGGVTIELDEPNDIYAHAITTGRAEIVEVLREWFSPVQRVELRSGDAAPTAPPKRLTDEMVRSERVAALRKRDPVLGAAIDALDLELTD